MVKLSAVGTISFEDVCNACKKYPNEKIIIVMANTKNQDAETIKQIGMRYPNIRFSVTGGLDPKKRKFNNEHYQERTYYSGMELSKIITIYSEIEREMDLDWTETQKAMFVYKKLCDRMEYSENVVNGKDYSRGIGGLLYNKAVCSGFAMIYKEAMDRLGIECHYQNKEGHHSWNIAKLDGKYRALELTWDTSNKGKNGCGFYYFNRSGDFYLDEHHDIKNESEERTFPIVPYTLEELQECYNVISQSRILNIQMNANRNNMLQTPELTIDGMPCIIYKSNDGNIGIRMINKNEHIRHKVFVRSDGSTFMLLAKKTKDPQLKKFLIVKGTENGIRIGKIYSEEELTSLPEQYDVTIANGLLSEERIKRKINNFNGYVGYIGRDHSIYYNSKIENDRLNIMR